MSVDQLMQKYGFDRVHASPNMFNPQSAAQPQAAPAPMFTIEGITLALVIVITLLVVGVIVLQLKRKG